MTLNELEKLKKIVNEDLSFTDDNIIQKILNQPNLFHKYLGLYIREKNILNQLDADKKDLYAKKWHYYKFGYTHKIDTQKELETYVNGDIDYRKVCVAYNEQELIINYLVEVLDDIKKSSYGMSNYTKYKQWLAGGNPT